MDSLQTYLNSLSVIEWELINVNSMLVTSKLEAVIASNNNIVLQEKVKLLEFKNLEIKSRAEQQQKGNNENTFLFI